MPLVNRARTNTKLGDLTNRMIVSSFYLYKGKGGLAQWILRYITHVRNKNLIS